MVWTDEVRGHGNCVVEYCADRVQHPAIPDPMTTVSNPNVSKIIAALAEVSFFKCRGPCFEVLIHILDFIPESMVAIGLLLMIDDD